MLTNFDEIPVRDRIIVALDCAEDEALRLADILSGSAAWVKVGMTLYYAAGPDIIPKLKQRGFNVFLDLKLHDIPHQVEGAARFATISGADMLTMHTMGGIDMMTAAQKGAQLGADDMGKEVPITLGITVLTSMDDQMLEEIGVNKPLHDEVMFLAGLARDAGISGVVASSQEAIDLRRSLGSGAFIVTPGIRPKGAARDDQSRVTTPAQAFKNGASHIVVGRPITQALDPLEAFESVARDASF